MTDEKTGGRAPARAALWIGAAAFLLLLEPWIPIPGVDTEAWSNFARWIELTPPTISPLTMSLGALVLIRLALAMLGGSERGLARAIAFVIYLVIIVIQSLAIAFWLENLAAQLPFGAAVVPEPGFRFRALAVLTSMAGAAVLWWLADRIDATRAVTGALAFALFAGLYDLLTFVGSSAEAIALSPSPENLRIIATRLVVPVCALVVTIALARRHPANWPLKIVGSLELRSGFDVLAAPAAMAALVEISVGTLAAPATARALFVIAGSVALVVLLQRTRELAPRRVLWPAGLALATLLGALAPLSLGIVSSGALSRAFAPGPLEGSARFELTLAAVDRFEDGEAEAMVRRLEAGGAVASVRSADEARITLRVEDAFDPESVLEALRPHTLALHLVTDFPATPLPADVNAAADHAYGPCEAIRALAPTLACHAAVEQHFVFETQLIDCQAYCLEPAPILTGRDVRDARVALQPQTGNIVVNATLRASATAHFEEVTRASVGRQLAIVVDGEIVSAPVIRAAIPGGELQIDLGGSRTYQESITQAYTLAQALTAGQGITSEWTLESLTAD